MPAMNASKIVAATSVVIAGAALAQAPFKSALPRAPCDDCGTVTSVQPITKELSSHPLDEGEPSGLVATIPFGNAPVRAGSSSHIGKDTPNVSMQWDVVVRLDDGRYQVVRLQAKPAFAQGDRVQVREGRLGRPPAE